MHSDEPAVVVSSELPDSGELFEKLSSYTICIQDKNGKLDWLKVETQLDLAAMDESDLRKALSDKVAIYHEDKVFVGNVNRMKRIKLDEEKLNSQSSIDRSKLASDKNISTEEQRITIQKSRRVNASADEVVHYEVNKADWVTALSESDNEEEALLKLQSESKATRTYYDVDVDEIHAEFEVAVTEI